MMGCCCHVLSDRWVSKLSMQKEGISDKCSYKRVLECSEDGVMRSNQMEETVEPRKKTQTYGGRSLPRHMP